MEKITDIIRARRSVRTFDGRPLSEDHKRALENYVSGLKTPFGGADFKLLDADSYGLSSPVIVGEKEYLAAKVERGDELAFGYAFESACLFALGLGIGTVMLAGTLNRGVFEKAMELNANEVMPCASPVGYPAAKMSVRETVMRKAIKADSRLAFGELFFDGGFGVPLDEASAGEYSDCLEMARLAPSAVNKQPWRAVKIGNNVHFYEVKTLKDAYWGDMQKVDMGIFLCHFHLTALEKGIEGAFAFTDPGVKAPENAIYTCSFISK